VAGRSVHRQEGIFTDAAQGVLDVLTGVPPAAVADPGWEHGANLTNESLEST
jgi:hypothetical protein